MSNPLTTGIRVSVSIDVPHGTTLSDLSEINDDAQEAVDDAIIRLCAWLGVDLHQSAGLTPKAVESERLSCGCDRRTWTLTAAPGEEGTWILQ